MPLLKRLVAVELKLSRTDDAFVQAVNDLGFADESSVALPADRARLVKSKLRAGFTAKGIGLLAVGPNNCRAILKAAPMRRHADGPIQHYCVERFWQLYLRGGVPVQLGKAQSWVARANSFARGVSKGQARSNEHRQTSLAVPPGEREAPH